MFFWRAQKYNSKKDIPAGATRRRMSFKRWHGPGLMIAKEGAQDGHTANVFISYRGQVTKSPIERVRKESSLENLAAGAWEAAIDEVVQAAKNDRLVNLVQPLGDEPAGDDEEQELQLEFHRALDFCPLDLDFWSRVLDLPPTRSQQPCNQLHNRLQRPHNHHSNHHYHRRRNHLVIVQLQQLQAQQFHC